MARARNIKPGFCRNEDLAECSVWARLCFALLPMMADREGRLEDRPKRIKGDLFPFDSVEVEPLLAELEQSGMIARYKVSGLGLIQVLGFRKHQNPHHREPESTLPPHPSLRLDPDGKYVRPEARPTLHYIKALDKPEARPGSRPHKSTMDGPSAVLIPDPGALIPDSGEETTAAAPLVVQPSPDDPQQQLPGTDPPKTPKAYAVPDCPYAALQQAYHDELAMLPSVSVLNDSRREHMRARWREVCAQEHFDADAGLEWFRWYFAHAARSKHLTGRGHPNRDTGRVWHATFDWLLLPGNFAKVIDGNYVDERAVQ
jgi:hypothetical protein